MTTAEIIEACKTDAKATMKHDGVRYYLVDGKLFVIQRSSYMRSTYSGKKLQVTVTGQAVPVYELPEMSTVSN